MVDEKQVVQNSGAGNGDVGEPVASNKILTIPNLLSLVRLALIPVIAVLYRKDETFWTLAVLAISGLTDIADGYIARRFNMISNLGKMLDPVADKLTQGIMLICLVFKFPHMLWALGLLVLREVTDSVTGICVIKKTGKVLGAEWHGKATTVIIYTTMVLHIIIPGIMKKTLSSGMTYSDAAIAVCMIMMALSLALYTLRNVKAILARRSTKLQKDEKQ